MSANKYKVILGTPENFKRIDYSAMKNNIEPPMMLDAWTQTTSDDFNNVFDSLYRNYQTKQEEDLYKKIHKLEEALRVQSEIISKIHHTSAISTAQSEYVNIQIQNPLTQTQTQNPAILTYNPATQTQNSAALTHNSSTQQHYYICQNAEQQYHEEEHGDDGQRVSAHNSQIPNSASTIVNGTDTILQTVKYTQATETSMNLSTSESRFDSAQPNNESMNSSDDSCGLRVCLSEENIKIQPAIMNASETAIQEPIEPLVKRRRFKSQNTLELESKNNNFVAYTNVPNTSPLSPTSSSTLNEIAHSTPTLTKTAKKEIIATSLKSTNEINMDAVMVSIGPNNTCIPEKAYRTINWKTASIATRKLLMQIFDRETLATHSMTGKPSPAFKDHSKPLKQMLNPSAIADIIFAVTRKCRVSEKEVRAAITTKCADENKMMKLQMNKKNRILCEMNKENVSVKRN